MDVWFEDDFPDLRMFGEFLGEPAVNFQRCRAKRDGNFFWVEETKHVLQIKFSASILFCVVHFCW